MPRGFLNTFCFVKKKLAHFPFSAPQTSMITHATCDHRHWNVITAHSPQHSRCSCKLSTEQLRATADYTTEPEQRLGPLLFFSHSHTHVHGTRTHTPLAAQTSAPARIRRQHATQDTKAGGTPHPPATAQRCRRSRIVRYHPPAVLFLSLRNTPHNQAQVALTRGRGGEGVVTVTPQQVARFSYSARRGRGLRTAVATPASKWR